MKKVLFTAFYYPPAGGAGVQRSSKFVKYLRDFGWDPVVLTIDEESACNLHSGGDKSLLEDIPEDIEVIRTPFSKQLRLRNSLQKMHLMGPAEFFLYPWFWEFYALWYKPALKAARNRLQKGDIKCIYTTSGPFTSLLVGARLKKEFDIPWVADLRDPYTQVNWGWPSKLHHKLCCYYEKKLLRKSDRVVVVSPSMKDLLCRHIPEISENIDVVENGYDAEDFENINVVNEDSDFTISFTGTLKRIAFDSSSSDKSLRHRLNPFRFFYYMGPPDIDRYPCETPEYFLKGVSAAFNICPELQKNIQIKFFGKITQPEEFNNLLESLNLTNNTQAYGVVNHVDAIKNMLESTCLFLATDRRLDGFRSATVTGKLYEYMASHKPILVVGGDSDASDFAVRSGLGVFHDIDDVEGIAQTILLWYKQWQAGGIRVSLREDFVNKFERKVLTKLLADSLNYVTGDS